MILMSLKLKNKLYSCNICTNNMKYNYRVSCPFCSVEICESCFQYSIMMDLKNPICIYCKKGLSLEFVLENNDTSWCKEKFIPFFENLCLEKEKSYLIDTMPIYKKMIEIRKLKKQIKDLPSNKKIEIQVLKEFRKNYQYDENNFEGLTKTQITKEKLSQIKKNKNFITLLNIKLIVKYDQKNKFKDHIVLLEGQSNKKIKPEKTITYICNCPNQKCRGFITNEYFCEICNLEMCDSCMIEKKENHICNRNDVKSSNMIRDSSKPCPKCYSPIFKISGCDQMFCTNCHVVFDWNTLKIDNGNVHNAHYFDWMTSQNDPANLILDEVACGDIMDIYRNLSHRLNYNNKYYDIQKVRNIFEVNRIFHGEIIDNIRENLIKNRFENYRLEYLDNKISEKTWKSKIAKDTINNEKYKSLIHIFEMYVTITSDFIRQLAFQKLTISKFLKNYYEFNNFFEKSVDETLQIFGGTLTSRQTTVVGLTRL